MNVLQEVENYINEYNQLIDEDLEIDSIRIEFSKQYKKEHLEQLGKWNKLQKNSNILYKLKNRLQDDEVTSVMRLEKYNIYYYNTNNDKPKYRKATMIIFGLKQYHKDPPPKHIVNEIVSLLNDITNIDLCLDMKQKPNLEALSRYFTLKQYVEPKSKKPTDTYYINDTNILMIDKITIYNKALKNSLDGILWRVEALIQIPNIKYLALPLQEFKEVIDIAKGK
ncbi:hypothetical protein OAR97_02515 [Arcobacteraceae bacterium]|nr:hypothetical protein [Arcobacteraceae bacterium]